LEENIRTREARNKKIIITGYDAAVKYLVEVAKANSTKGPVRNEGIATIVLGRPAAGKSIISERIAHLRYAALIDSEKAKKIIPEYDNGLGVQAVHVESCDLSALVADRLIDDKANLVFPTVGTNLAYIRSLVQMLGRLGYQVDLVHVDVAPDEAFRRMIGLYKERLIALDYINAVGDKPRQTYYTIKREGLAHEAVEIDANGAVGEHVITDGADTKLAACLRPRRS
jgi:hypothetical protein